MNKVMKEKFLVVRMEDAEETIVAVRDNEVVASREAHELAEGNMKAYAVFRLVEVYIGRINVEVVRVPASA